MGWRMHPSIYSSICMSHNPNATPALPFALPCCLVDAVRGAGPTLLVDAHTTRPCQQCPACNQAPARVHSRYLRVVRDLPVADCPLRLLLRVRRSLSGRVSVAQKYRRRVQRCCSPSRVDRTRLPLACPMRPVCIILTPLHPLVGLYPEIVVEHVNVEDSCADTYKRQMCR